MNESPRQAFGPTTRPPALALLGLTLLYYLLARFGMALFALQPANITLIWLPSGLGLIVCLWAGWRAVPLLMMASFAANYPGMADGAQRLPWLHTGVVAMADGLGVALAAQMARRRLPQGLQRTGDLLTLGLWVCLLPTALSSLVLASNLVWGGYIAAEQLGHMVMMLVLADSLGMVLVYQLYEGWQPGGERNLRSPWFWGGAAGLVLLLAISAGALKGMLFFVLPLLVVLSFKLSLSGVTLLSTLVLVAGIVATAQGLGPFATGRPEEAQLELMAFTFSSALTVLGVALQNRQLHRSQRFGEQWRAEAEHDPLTGLMNRRAFQPRLLLEHQRAQRSGRPYSLAMLDLDHFKQINDRHGHAFGDDVLVAVASLMRQCSRAIDAVARLGGEEFVILLPDTSPEEAFKAMERLRVALASQRLLAPGGVAVQVTASLGLAGWRGGADGANDVLQRADRALYAAKAAGRNRIVVD
ncbi:diguanylate cyclase [Paucibacter sp. APW11]|uniref:diguanylate cyclase n=1 Tax=Roseateles aquae TaxID=3077235 RepID=A0ABU3PFT9_9BURK|nr:diguanylate cyclase [Paucibacter sp. APW11]MDT9001391.1 diguanylate cyclase [Paucibacter sp. APW11]